MRRILTKEEWVRRKRIKESIMLAIIILLFIFIIIVVAAFVSNVTGLSTERNKVKENDKETLSQNLILADGTAIQTEYLTPNKYSRPQLPLKYIKGIVVHYTANPGTGAEANRNYFEGLAVKETTYVSSHFVIGLKGEIVQCIPITEESYASNNRNKDTISIECCHPDSTGKFNKKTYKSLVSLAAAICATYDLKEKDIIRHYDVTGKLCPLYYVKHEDDWKTLKKDIMKEAQIIHNSKNSSNHSMK